MKNIPIFGAVCALASVLASASFGQTAPSRVLHKVEMRDPPTERQMMAQGAQLIADYGSYRLYEAANPPADGQLRDDYNKILLNAKTLDTSTPEIRALSKSAGAFTGKRLHIVHFAGPPQPQWRASLLATGARIVAYLPQNAYLIYGDASALGSVQQMAAASPFVQWHGDYLDDYKIHPLARASQTGRFAIQLTRDDAANIETLKLVDRLKLEPLERQAAVLDYINVIGRFSPADLPKIAAQPDVISIQPYGVRRKLGERQDQIVAGAVTNGSLTGPGYLAWLESKGFTQQEFDLSGFAVDVSDSGIDDGTKSPHHFGLHEEGNVQAASRVTYNQLFGKPHPGSTLAGCDGHGNLNAHIVAGWDDFTGFPFEDNENYHYGLGVCPFVALGSSVVFDPVYFTSPNYTTLQSTAYHNGARISNNSWGGGGPDGTFGVYDVDAQQYDALVRDAEPANSPYPTAGNQEMVIIFAAGNNGLDTNSFAPAPGTMSTPATAKNVITVGAAENVQPFNADGAPDSSFVYDFESDNANGLIDFSSRGPCQDGRHKPDLVAPGTHVSGGAPQAANPGIAGAAMPCFRADNKITFDSDGFPSDTLNAGVSGGPITSPNFPFFPNGQQFYTASSGTSHAAPCVSGGCALLRQYFINQGWAPPSPAMTKAFLMNSARYLDGPNAGGTLWSDGQGMGEMNLGMAFDGAPRVLRDQLPEDLFTASGTNRTFTGEIADASQPFRVTVAWTDAPGSTTGAAYNNDLDLIVTVAGVKYLGNVFSGAFSTTAGTRDGVNNVESVFLPAGSKGAYTVTVYADNINSIGVPNSGNQLMQDFALVIYNSAPGHDPIIAAAGATATLESCSNNGVISPGESVTESLALQNVGGSPTANLVATLLSTNGVIGPSAPQVYGQLAAGGPPVAAPFTFHADGVCGGTVTAVLQLQDGATNLGTVNFNFQLGQMTTTAPLAQSFSNGIPGAWGNTSGLPHDFWSATNDGGVGTVAYVGDADTTNLADLISPPIFINGLSPQLTFQHRYNLESPGDGIAYDGGILEIKIGNGGFTDILSAGGTFASNGYNASIIAEGGNPLSSQLAWSGNSSGYINTVVNLPPAVIGQMVQFEWICATDVLNDPGILLGSAGWWILQATVTDQLPDCCVSGPVTAVNILEPSSGAQITSTASVVSGSGTPGDTVIVSVNSISNATLAVDPAGFFQGMITLDYGTNVVTAHQQPLDPSDSPAIIVQVSPAAPSLNAPAVSGAPVALTGQGAAGANVVIFDNVSATVVATLNADAAGHFSGDAPLSLGSHSLTASETISGVTSAVSAPITVEVVNLANPAILFPPSGFATNNPALTIQGAAVSGAAIAVDDNGAQIGTSTADGNGAFSFAGKFSNGIHLLTVIQTVGGVVSGASPAVEVTVQLQPVILVQPQSQNGFIGGGVTFSVTGYGAAPLTYSWQRNGAPIAGATRPALTLAPLTARSEADYQVIVRNASGLEISDSAFLTLVTNPYPPLAGNYSGLFMAAPADFPTSGLLNLTLTPLGRFTGRITGGGVFPFSGSLSAAGQGQVTVNRGARLPPLSLNLFLGLTNNPPPLTGQVSDGVWKSTLQAGRAVFSAAHPFPQHGNDSAIFGNGYASIAVGLNGYAAWHGFLPDNTPMAPPAVSVSAEGQWPLYVPLYGNAGALFGWIDFTNSGASLFSGGLTWVRTNKFTNTLSAFGAKLAPPPFPGLTNLQIVVQGGDVVSGPLTNQLALLRSGVLKPLDATIPGLVVSVNPVTGIVTGHFPNPTTHTPEQIKGIVYQAQTNASGFFRDVNGSGSFVISPADH